MNNKHSGQLKYERTGNSTKQICHILDCQLKMMSEIDKLKKMGSNGWKKESGSKMRRMWR